MEQLHRQRALLQEHLRWIESEIAAEATRSSADHSTPTAPQPTPAPIVSADLRPAAPASLAPADATGTSSSAAELPEPNVRGIHSEVRSGCLLYFGIAFAILGLAVAYIFWWY